MSLLTMLLILAPLLMGCRRLRRLQQDGRRHAALRLYRRMSLALGGIVLLSMAAQEALLLLGGQLSWATGLPLHLCCLMGLLLLPALLTRRGLLLHPLLYAGAPGAALALVFPAVPETFAPLWMTFFFCVMHAGIVQGPLLPLTLGWRPHPRGAVHAFVFLLAAGVVASIVNRITGGNYLFLSWPVAGTPLMALSRWGKVTYRALLAALAGGILAAEALLLHLHRRRSEK